MLLSVNLQIVFSLKSFEGFNFLLFPCYHRNPDISFLFDHEKRELEKVYKFQNPISVSMVTVSTEENNDNSTDVVSTNEKQVFYDSRPSKSLNHPHFVISTSLKSIGNASEKPL